jgi:hypothetical protein
VRTILEISTDKIYVEAKVENGDFEKDVFTVQNEDYLIEITRDTTELKVTNAMDGYGYNCRDTFKDAIIIVNHLNLD